MKYLLILLIGVLPTVSQAQKTVVPASVSETFSKLFPDAQKVKWSKENSVYEAGFKSKGEHISVEIDSNGNWISTAHDVKTSELPETIQTSINSLYAKNKILEVEMGEAANIGQHYQVELKSEGKQYKLIYSLSGQLISNELDH